jgi:hypothetical protein
MRGQVKKYLEYFKGCCNKYGDEAVLKCLKTGVGLKLPLNGKDRREMINELFGSL